MRGFLLITCLLLITLSHTYSQTDKGTILLGGYSRVTLDTDGDYDFGLNPNFGYFLGEHACLGTSMPLHFFSNGYYIGISPFFRYYFGENDKTRFFGLTSVNFKLSDNVYIGNNGWVDLGAGYVWFINKSVGLETELIGNLSPDKAIVGLYLGIQVYLNRN